MVRRAFTLIELLVIIGIMAVLVSVAVVNVRAGQGAVRVKGATRDIFAAIRQARSTALVTQQPAIITYSTEEVDGEVVAKVEITSSKLLDTTLDRSKVQTLTGAPLPEARHELVHIEEKTETAKADAEGSSPSESSGQAVEDILFSSIEAEVVKGMRLKVVMGDELLSSEPETRKPKISVFSNVDYLLGRYKEAQASAAAESAKKDDADLATPTAAPAAEDQNPVSVVWEANGRVEPHLVYVYEDGTRPESGLLVRIDRFGTAKVVSGDGRDNE